jgi:tRNA uridine 5-carboxymethylaminomethyl modification enzyme
LEKEELKEEMGVAVVTRKGTDTDEVEAGHEPPLVVEKEKMVEKIISFLDEKSIDPDEINSFLKESGTSIINQKVKAVAIALRPQIRLKDLINIIEGDEMKMVRKSEMFDELMESAEIRLKYEGYIKREKLVADKIKRLEGVKIPDDISYEELISISTEGRQKLARIKPVNIGQAGRISGVSPSDINILLMYLGR